MHVGLYHTHIVYQINRRHYKLYSYFKLKIKYFTTCADE